jgi:hypothetical protein
VCINLGSKVLSQPTPQLEVSCLTTSNIDNLMLLPVSVAAAKDLKPGMCGAVLAEALMVSNRAGLFRAVLAL